MIDRYSGRFSTDSSCFGEVFPQAVRNAQLASNATVRTLAWTGPKRSIEVATTLGERT
jgi:hypothetical protein